MLKISFSETPSEERWILQGRLTAPWLRELRAYWKKNHHKDNQRACIVDLNEITFIDKGGERLLRFLVKEGAQCIATGDYTKHVVEKWTTKGKGSLLNQFTGVFVAAVVSAFATRFGAEFIASAIYIKHAFQLTTQGKGSVLDRLTGFFFAAAVAVFAVLIGGATAKAQNAAVTGSVPSGPASDQVSPVDSARGHQHGVVERSSHSNCRITISGFDPNRSGGPQVPTPLEVNTCILPILLNPYTNWR